MTYLVHNHGPDVGRGLDCPEKFNEAGERVGYCVNPVLWEGRLPGNDTIVPVHFEGRVVGDARISPDGQIMNVEIDQQTGRNFIEAVSVGLIDGLSIGPNYSGAQPLIKHVPSPPLNRSEKRRLWFSNKK